MTVIRVNFLPEFDNGYDAVLLTMDGAGVDAMRAALVETISAGSAQLDRDGVSHVFQIDSGAADLELTPTRVVWHLDPKVAQELELDLQVLSDKGAAGHTYIDIISPAETLVVSRDEYVDVVYPWEAPPPKNPG